MVSLCPSRSSFLGAYTTGVNMRGMQGEMDDFRHCIRPQGSRRRPPNKLKSTFYEDPPRRPESLPLLGRFLKVMNIGTTGITGMFFLKL